MRLLFDQNLSPRLARSLSDLFPDSIHVRDVSLHLASDQKVWDYAVREGLVIVSKDSDFHQRSFLHGHPPKVVWVRTGNCSTSDIEALLRSRSAEISAFETDSEAAFLALA